MADSKTRIEQILEYALGREESLPFVLSRMETILVELIKLTSNASQLSVKGILKIAGRVDTVSELPNEVEEGTLYFVGYATDEKKAEYIRTSEGKWEMLGFDSFELDRALSDNSTNPVQNKAITLALRNKVDVESGKGLSTNDFSDAEKAAIAKFLKMRFIGEDTITTYTDPNTGKTVFKYPHAECFNHYGSVGNVQYNGIVYYPNTYDGNFSHTEGSSNITQGICTHVEGFGNRAYSDYGHAEGVGCTISKKSSYAHVEGHNSVVQASTGHAEGDSTNSSGIASHAQGTETWAYGQSSHAGGTHTVAYYNNSFAHGVYVNAPGENGFAIGKYSKIPADKSKFAFIIGNGVADSDGKSSEDSENRSNAFAVDWNGLIYVNNSENGIDISKMLTSDNIPSAQQILDTVTHVYPLSRETDTVLLKRYGSYGMVTVEDLLSDVYLAIYTDMLNASCFNYLNLIPKTETNNGVTMSISSDGIVTLNGTASDDTTFNLSSSFVYLDFYVAYDLYCMSHFSEDSIISNMSFKLSPTSRDSNGNLIFDAIETDGSEVNEYVNITYANMDSEGIYYEKFIPELVVEAGTAFNNNSFVLGIYRYTIYNDPVLRQTLRYQNFQHIPSNTELYDMMLDLQKKI